MRAYDWTFLKVTLWISSLIYSVSGQNETNITSISQTNVSQTNETASMACESKLKQFNSDVHKKKYRVGIFIVRGFDQAQLEYNLTFGDYLTKTAGQRFTEPIEFETVPVNLKILFDLIANEELDFFWANPGALSCVGVEVGAEPLATIISHLEVRGHVYDLDVFGGVMFTQANNDAINNINDLKDKVIGAGGITMINGGQMQFYEMVKAGMSYVMDPQQVVFTADQDLVVQGVLNGEFDVGFVRTDQIERTKDKNGKPVDPDLFKVIQPNIYVLDDGTLFPFLHSTDIVGEWPVAALNSVPKDVSEEVQKALLAFGAHADAARRVQAGGTLSPTRCDTTLEIAQSALSAANAGRLSGFRSSRSYFDIRTMHEAGGFMIKDEKGDWECTRADTLYGSITCPAGHYKLPLEKFEASCANAGLPCKEGYQCYCKPCVAAYEVDVFEWDAALTATENTGCAKMSLCGTVEQTKTITFHAIDNKERPDAKFKVMMHMANDDYEIPVERVGDYSYEFNWTETDVGVGIMEIFIDDQQVPESPIRVQVIDRMCELDYPGQDRTHSATGECVCSSTTIEMGHKCVSSTILAVIVSISAAIVVAIMAYFFLRWRNFKNDQMWHINLDELHLDDPPEVIGQGSFGVVLLAEYRGTRVAIKRAVKTSGSRHSRKGSRNRSKNSKGGSKNGSKNGSSGASSGPTDPTNSVGMSIDVTQSQNEDPEIGQSDSDLDPGESKGSGGRSNSGSGKKTGSKNSKSGGKGADDGLSSLGFLGADYGPVTGWARLFPWMRKDDYNHLRFRQTILGASSAGSLEKKTLMTRLCPYFSQQAREEEAFIAEMRVLSRLRHPCITTVMGAVISNTHDPMLVMEYMEYGSLYDLLRNESLHLSGEVIMQVTRDVAQGLRYLHASKPSIEHGDLKARNILIDSRFRAKLCDFGLSTKNKNLITGTPYWLAPEYLRGQTAYTPACDMYSIGIIIYEIYSRKSPYEGEHFRDTLRKICDRRVNKRPPIPKTCPPKFVDLMKKCWSPDPYARPQAKDLDAILLDMSTRDAEPLQGDDHSSQNVRATGDMLYQLFPKHIADALKSGQKVEPESHELVTIVFSDIVHFTDISRELSPLKVSQMLDRLYLAFDKVAGKHHVFKVETIGDAYMGVTNLERNQEDTHVKQAAEFAIDIVKEASQILIDEDEPVKGYLSIRVGFHCGPVVSNVVGSLNPRYSLVGDTVNTASRMESNSKANRVLCSDKAYKLLLEQAPEIPVVRRGKIAVKGKGEMQVYWVGDKLINFGAVGNFPQPTLDPGMAAPAAKIGFLGSETVDDKLWRHDLERQGEGANNNEAEAAAPGLV